jgi:hypothetical protein
LNAISKYGVTKVEISPWWPLTSRRHRLRHLKVISYKNGETEDTYHYLQPSSCAAPEHSPKHLPSQILHLLQQELGLMNLAQIPAPLRHYGRFFRNQKPYATWHRRECLTRDHPGHQLLAVPPPIQQLVAEAEAEVDHHLMTTAEAEGHSKRAKVEEEEHSTMVEVAEGAHLSDPLKVEVEHDPMAREAVLAHVLMAERELCQVEVGAEVESKLEQVSDPARPDQEKSLKEAEVVLGHSKKEYGVGAAHLTMEVVEELGPALLGQALSPRELVVQTGLERPCHSVPAAAYLQPTLLSGVEECLFLEGAVDLKVISCQ